MIILTRISLIVFLTAMGIYYLQLLLLMLCPAGEPERDTPYTDGIDITFFIVIPCLNEEQIIARTVRQLLQLKMKQTRIIITDDASDDKTAALIEEGFKAELARGEVILLKRKLPDARKGKGHSLNYTYRYISQLIGREGLDPARCVMGVFDADVSFNRELLERAAVIMDRQGDIDLIQARVRTGAAVEGLFARLQDLEFYIIINKIQNFRRYTGTVAAAGNGQFNRFSAIDPETPWTDCLLEDFDFSARILLKGRRTCLVQSQAVCQQSVKRYGAFLRQRARWCQGGLQCLKYAKRAWASRHLSIWGKAEITAFLLIPYITAAAVVNMIFALLFTKSAPGLWQAAISCTLAFAPGFAFARMYRREAGENALSCVLCGLLLPVYTLSQAPAVFMAFYRQLKGKKEWVKTRHNMF